MLHQQQHYHRLPTLFKDGSISNSNSTSFSSRSFRAWQQQRQQQQHHLPALFEHGNGTTMAAVLMLDTSVGTMRPSRPGMVNRSSLMNRYSYAGSGSTRRYPSPPTWACVLRGAGSHSPLSGSSPRVMCLSDGGEMQGSDDNNDDMFLDGPKDSSFVLVLWRYT
jgi:hypothetical protein